MARKTIRLPPALPPRRRGRIPSYFATGVKSIEDEGDIFRITFAMRHDFGNGNPEDVPIVQVILTATGYQDLARRTTLGKGRRTS